MLNMEWKNGIKTFYTELSFLNSDEDYLDFCRKKILHGTPFVFLNKEDEYYSFRKKIASEFKVSYHGVNITGSGKLGFSYFKVRAFSLDSDIDVAIISPDSFDYIMGFIYDFQMKLKVNRINVSAAELKSYHSFLEYTALGWIRPDLLPKIFNTKELRNGWFDFFNGLSYNKSEVGNYKVAAGIFRSYEHLEKYTVNSLQNSFRKNNDRVSKL
ncbi:Uncharacterised protein [Enterobacter hormaechei]|uniref:hypothetical protein n=1 Tax=Enterobacter hormaechei TaxID=158836 RepID=UPI0007980F05|nr:hypothetical protein [Enterobacter hormaechei]CZU56020.1 Uncharacterised protein [Enterobacter hormaechei]